MKKRKYLVLSALTYMFLITGCGNKTSNDQMMEQLEQEVAHNVAYVGNENGMESYNIEATIDGSEEELIVKVLSDTKIMNAPSTEGTVVGQVRKDEKVIVLNKSSEDGWYKIGFNGRVCYIIEESLDMENDVEEEKDEEETQVNNGENSKPLNNSTSSKPNATTEKTSTTEKTGTTTEKTDTTEKTGTSTVKPSTTTEESGTTSEKTENTTEERPIWPSVKPGTTTEERPIWPSEKPGTTIDDPVSTEIWSSEETSQDNFATEEPWYDSWYEEEIIDW